MKALWIVFIAGAVLAQTPPPAQKSPAAPAKAPAAPAKMGSPPPALLNPAGLKAKAPDVFKVKFVTSHGDFTVESHRDWAPLGVDRFYNLVRAKFLTDNYFYRYVPGFIVQFGVSAWPDVTKAWMNAKIKDDPLKESNKKGTLTFATSGPDARTTDFFINVRDNAGLDGMGFRPIGMVVEGMDIVEGLYSGYGEMKEQPGGTGPSQMMVMEQGKPYLEKNFPKLDYIKTATIISGDETKAPASPKSTPTKMPPPPPKK